MPAPNPDHEEVALQSAAVLLPVPVCERLCDALARDIPAADALQEIELARAAILGPGLLTVNLVVSRPDAASRDFQLRRAWSSRPADYPVGGGKRKSPTPWSEQLLVRGEVFVGEGEAALAAVFDDSARILALGLRCVVNVPLRAAGECRATFNVLGTQAHWQPRDVALIRLLALLARPFVVQIAVG